MRIKLPGIVIVAVLLAIAYFAFIKPRGGLKGIMG